MMSQYSRMKIRPLLFNICLVGALLVTQDRVRSQAAPTPSSAFKIAAHRGDWRNHPENSIRAIRSCIEAGVDIVEVDVQRTADGVFVLLHDETLNRTTNGSGRIAELPADSILQLRLKEGYGFLTRERIPALEEALIFSKGRTALYLDKALPHVGEIYPLLKNYDLVEQVYFGSSLGYAEVRKVVGSYLDSIQFIPFITIENPEKRAFAREYIARINPAVFGLRVDNDPARTSDIRDYLKENGKQLWISSARANGSAGHDDEVSLQDPRQGWGWLQEFGADIIMTDRPLMLSEYRRSLR